MKSPIMLGKGIIVSVVRLGLPADLDHARWREIGTTLSHLERAVAWWVGDWWAFGEHRYGALREISEDRGWPGPAYQTCANAAAVCRAFEISRRRETLSFSHHEAVAALAPAEQDRLLDQAERERWSRQQLRDAVRSGRSVVRLAVRSIELPTRRSITVPAKRAADRVAVPRIIARVSKAVSPPMTKGSAREAECDLAHFLKQFEDSYGGIRGFAPVIERMREAQAMLSQIVLCTT